MLSYYVKILHKGMKNAKVCSFVRYSHVYFRIYEILFETILNIFYAQEYIKFIFKIMQNIYFIFPYVLCKSKCVLHQNILFLLKNGM